MIRPANPEDAQQIAEIYNYYVINTVVTFEETPVTKEIMTARVAEVQAQFPWLVFEANGKIMGYAYAGPWKQRAAYRHSVEISVYLLQGESGKGLGTALYASLLDHLTRLDIHAIIGGIALPNDACVALHQKFGFEQIAHFKEVGYKFGKWIDVVYFEKRLP